MTDEKIRNKIHEITEDVPVYGQQVDGVTFEDGMIMVTLRPLPGFSGAVHTLCMPRVTRRYELLKQLVMTGYGTITFTETQDAA